ncbi:MAG: hypothetical protein ACRDR6_18050 [Pseudonocardiaceae bacterium]
MALLVVIATVLLLRPMVTSGKPIFSRIDLLTFYASLTAVGTTGLALLTRRPWRAVLAWLTAGVFVTILIDSYTPSATFYLGMSTEVGSTFIVSFYDVSWWQHIVSWWTLYAALTLFVHRKPSPVPRVLAAVDVLAILRCITPSHAYLYVEQIGLVDLIRLMSGPLNVDTSTALQVAPGILFLLGMLIVVAAWRFGVIVKSLILPA